MTPPAMVVGVCTYNRGPKIERTLAAIAAMDRCGGRLTRLVVVDNRSTDGTAAAIDRFIAAGPSLPTERVFEPAPGKPAALRRLFDHTSEPIVAMLDDDVLPERAWATALLRLFDAETRAGAAGGPVQNEWESGPTYYARVYRRSLGDQWLGERRVRLDEPGAFLMGGAMAMRREAVEQTGWLHSRLMDCRRGERLDTGDDAELCIRMRQAGWGVWYEPAAQAKHLIPAERQTRRYMARLRESICRSEPWLRWIARGQSTGDEAWAQTQARRARRLWLKTLLFDGRPRRRRIRLAERAGRVRGWEGVLDHLRRQAPPEA